MELHNIAQHPSEAVLNACAVFGVLGYLLSHWVVLRGLVKPGNLGNKLFRGFCFCLLLFPLCWRWFLPNTAIVAISALMAAMGGVAWLRQRKF